MPRKHPTPTSKLQNRDNQRRSRARRRDVLASLQQRVAEYERRDAQATLQMQAAARAVLAENQRLRALLRRRGVSQPEIDAYLAAPDGPGEGHAVVPSSNPTPQAPAASAPALALAPCRNSSGQERESTLCANTCTSPLAADPQVEPPPPSAGPRDTLELSCDEAAEIIATFRGHADPEAARAALGCSGPAACRVDNLRIFQLMDADEGA
ncbi:hypothetical protein GGS23DRAFT_77812 [Durotheca rogersii]|uniref:uncharacterized protein n=1 Tax=Durotheca rogersii TaxID=419775 RepID=UPI00221FC033|nr:uncharacterized protein GGS23DRAFT_77812 [Durotheca rogersii]KAI5862481.1 hypothetical protein GGS23DRAFT_77812 [Durotheca rogersii]